MWALVKKDDSGWYGEISVLAVGSKPQMKKKMKKEVEKEMLNHDLEDVKFWILETQLLPKNY